jgi:hypothetical protein
MMPIVGKVRIHKKVEGKSVTADDCKKLLLIYLSKAFNRTSSSTLTFNVRDIYNHEYMDTLRYKSGLYTKADGRAMGMFIATILEREFAGKYIITIEHIQKRTQRLYRATINTGEK